jgi:hypothetical protein
MQAKDWQTEGVKLCKGKIYKTPIGKELGPYKLTDKYQQTVPEIARRRITLAGARLASLLNKELK